ncbi:MAG: KpsF/GutQ family sugar-phosphate isomerase [Alistipes sp.]|nr:KpsF/GutQ family sugar-phosphate isomerase [Alistipes sp.]
MTDTTKKQILDVARKAIHTEMQALGRLEETLGDEFAAAVELILACRGKCIITGMGKSGLVGRKIAATLASTGTPSFFLHPGEAFHGDLGMISPDDVVVALSYSGETDEILKIVPFIHSNGNRLVSMTGNPESALAKNSDVHLNVGVKEEACILHLAPTTSTTAQIAMGDALAVSLMRMRNFTSVDFARLHPGGSLGRRLLMTVGNVMRSHDLPVVAPDCPAAEMIHAISKGGLGLIVVCDGDRVEGIVTDGDVRRAMERRRADFFNIVAADIATPNPKSIAASEKLIEAEKMMTNNKVTSLLVTGDDGKLQGVIQIYDIKL